VVVFHNRSAREGIAGLERPTSGVIHIGGQAVYQNKVLVPTHERELGMAFQSYAVWPHMSVFGNVAFPLTVAEKRPSRAEIRNRVAEYLALVGLDGAREEA
jgi:iron(III) transport system ATP-binding protein